MQITWDRFAVPTITGDDDLDVVRGIGYAQAVAVGNDVLELYGIARGRSAEYWGERFLVEDTFTAQLGLQAKTDEWLGAQLPETLARIEAFCEGFNEACAEDDARGGDRRETLPVTPRDVIAHTLRILVRFNQIDGEQLAFSPTDFYGVERPGSSSWAVSGKLSSTGNALVMINPHLSWKLKYHRFVEFATVSPGREFHGCTLVGVPWQSMGYSKDIAWAHTVNPIRNLVAYELDLADGTYPLGDERLPLQTIEHTIAVKDADPVTVIERRTVHGPVVTAPDGTDVAIRIAGVLDEPAHHALEGWWQLSLATTVEELFATHDRLWLPMYTITAGDSSGSVGALFCGTPPVRETWADSKRRMDGADPASQSFAVHPASAMPRVIDPECGWVNNCNETPYLFTSPPLDEADYPPAIAPPVTEVTDMRPYVSRDWLARQQTVSPEQLLAFKYSKHAVLADLVLDQLLEAADKHDDLAKPVEVLRAWDREMGATSRGYVLCLLTMVLSAQTLFLPGKFFEPTDDPGQMPTRLADPDAVVEFLRMAAGLMGLVGIPLDAPLGDLVTIGPDDLPANGSSGFLGGFKCLETLPGASGGLEVVVGDTWVSRVELREGQEPVAGSLLVYGNTTDPAAPAAEDQYAIWNADGLRPRE